MLPTQNCIAPGSHISVSGGQRLFLECSFTLLPCFPMCNTRVRPFHIQNGFYGLVPVLLEQCCAHNLAGVCPGTNDSQPDLSALLYPNLLVC